MQAFKDAKVTQVKPASQAVTLGVKQGWLIVKIDGRPIAVDADVFDAGE